MAKKLKPKLTEYEFHPIAAYLPLLEGEEFDKLVKDIEQHGQIEPAALYEGKILDGRNRYRACQVLGIEVLTKEWQPSEARGITPLDYVVSENILRRHLNEAQRAEIGFLMEQERENIEKERKTKMNHLTAKMRQAPEDEKNIIQNEIDNLRIPDVDKIVKKIRLSDSSFSKAKIIKKMAETEPIVAEQWEKAKQGKTGIKPVYQKAKILEKVSELLPKEKANEIREKIKQDIFTPKIIMNEIQEIQDNLKRTELAKKSHEDKKLREAQEKAELQIRDIEKRIDNYRNAMKDIKANLIVLAKEIVAKYPQFQSESPDRVITELGEYYNTFNLHTFDEQIHDLKKEYDELKKPLLEQLQKLDDEFNKKKAAIDEVKQSKNSEVKWIEKHQNDMLAEYEKEELYKKKVKELKKELEEANKDYDNKFSGN